MKNDFFDVGIDFYNENLTGDVSSSDGRTIFIGEIESGSRKKNMHYYETPMKGSIMSKASETSNTPKFAEKLKSLKPANLADEKKRTVLRGIYYTGGFVTGVLATVAVVAVKSYYNSFSDGEFQEIEKSDD